MMNPPRIRLSPLDRLEAESIHVMSEVVGQTEARGIGSKRIGTQGLDVDCALLVDGLMAGREQGITIDVAYRSSSARA